MKKITLGYIFNEENLKKDEKVFLNLAKKKNMEIVLVNTSKGLNEEELEKKINKCDIFFNNSAENFSMEIVKTIEELGKKVIDSSKKFYYDEDKWMFFMKCKKNNIPTLNTILLSENINTAKKELKEFNSWPVILKRIEGATGDYVDKADNLGQAEKIIRNFWKKGSEKLPVIAQEFVKSQSYRVTIIGDKIAQTAIKKSNGWKATGVYMWEDNVKKFKIDKELKKIIDKIIKSFGIKVCGIDFLKKGDDWLVLEVNSQPGLDFFPKERKKLISKILDLLKREVKK